MCINCYCHCIFYYSIILISLWHAIQFFHFVYLSFVLSFYPIIINFVTMIKLLLWWWSHSLLAVCPSTHPVVLFYSLQRLMKFTYFVVAAFSEELSQYFFLRLECIAFYYIGMFLWPEFVSRNGYCAHSCKLNFFSGQWELQFWFYVADNWLRLKHFLKKNIKALFEFMDLNF